MDTAHELGATLEDWLHFGYVLGLEGDLLPIVHDANARPAPGSKVKAFGKIPSVYTFDDNAIGLLGWQDRVITQADIEEWASEPRYSLCVRCSAIRAIDVDCTDPELAAKIAGALGNLTYPIELPIRERANSSKFLLAFRLEGKHKKRIINLPNNERIEFLADGQQFVAAGRHPSGAMYEWVNGLPTEFPTLTIEHFEKIWNEIATTFGVRAGTSSSDARNSVTGGASDRLELGENQTEILSEIAESERATLRDALFYPPLLEAAGDNTVWSEVGYALLSTNSYELWLEFSQAAPNYSEHAPSDWWTAHQTQVPHSDYRHLFTLARKLGWRPVANPEAFPLIAPAVDASPDARDPQSTQAQTQPIIGQIPEHKFACTDLANANRLRAAFGGTHLVVRDGSFYAWLGHSWSREDGEQYAARYAAELSGMVKLEAEAAWTKARSMAEDLAGAEDIIAVKHKSQSQKVADYANQSTLQQEFVDTLLKAELLDKWARQCEMMSTQEAAVKLLRKTLA